MSSTIGIASFELPGLAGGFRIQKIPDFHVHGIRDFVGMTNYLLGITENRNPVNTDLNELHLQDDTIEILKSE